MQERMAVRMGGCGSPEKGHSDAGSVGRERRAVASDDGLGAVTEAGVEGGGGDGHRSSQYEIRAEVTEKVTMGRGVGEGGLSELLTSGGEGVEEPARQRQGDREGT